MSHCAPHPPSSDAPHEARSWDQLVAPEQVHGSLYTDPAIFQTAAVFPTAPRP